MKAIIGIVFGLIALTVFFIWTNQPTPAPSLSLDSPQSDSSFCTFEPTELDERTFSRIIRGETFTETLVLEGPEWNDTLIEECVVRDTAGDGIVLRDVERVVIRNCDFVNIGGQAAIRGSITDGTKDVLVEGNRISDVAENGITFGQRAAQGIDHERLRIRGNQLFDTGQNRSDGKSHAIYVQAQDAEITHNRIGGQRDGNGISIRSSGVVTCNTITGQSHTDKPGIRYYSDHQTGPTRRLELRANHVEDQRIGIELFPSVARYDGFDDGTHVVERFVITENQLLGNEEAIRIAPEYLSRVDGD